MRKEATMVRESCGTIRLAATIALSFVSAACLVACVSANERREFPFTVEEDADGARYVWFIYGQAGLPYDYMPARTLRDSPHFRSAPGNRPQTGDVAWWKAFVAIYDPETDGSKKLLTARGAQSLDVLEKRYGPVLWLRYWKFDLKPRGCR